MGQLDLTSARRVVVRLLRHDRDSRARGARRCRLERNAVTVWA
jgi:hypothetical protein